jgi:hypothetical protein
LAFTLFFSHLIFAKSSRNNRSFRDNFRGWKADAGPSQDSTFFKFCAAPQNAIFAKKKREKHARANAGLLKVKYVTSIHPCSFGYYLKEIHKVEIFALRLNDNEKKYLTKRSDATQKEGRIFRPPA